MHVPEIEPNAPSIALLDPAIRRNVHSISNGLNSQIQSLMTAPNASQIPIELIELDQWVVWRLESRGGKSTKVPYGPCTGQRASVTDPGSWASFSEALGAYHESEGRLSGIGFVLSGIDGIGGVDIDHVRDPHTGDLHPEAQALIDRFGSYTEVSPSGTGIRIFGLAPRMSKGRSGMYCGIKVECYSAGRYLTVTGQHLNGHNRLTPIGEALVEVAQALGTQTLESPVSPAFEVAATTPAPLATGSDKYAELIRRILAGDVYHDALRDLAAAMTSQGMRGAAIVSHLKALMAATTAPHDVRWQARMAEIPTLVRSAVHKFAANDQPEVALTRQLSNWRAVDRFTGEPKQRQWLVNGIFPIAQASLLAASGGVGKSFLLLSLAREVAGNDGTWLNAPSIFGGLVVTQGIAVYITAEDDAIEVHSRLASLGAIPPQLYVVPLPDAGGAIALFAPDLITKAPATTAAWTDLERQFDGLEQVKLIVFDPLQPLCALDLNVPENAQFVCSRLAALAARTGASVIVSHHFAKREASTPEQAREAIRGTGGLVDGVRAVYALWQPRDDDARAVMKQLHLPYQRGCVVCGGVVKANGRAQLKVVTYVRDERGLLCDRTDDLVRLKTSAEDQLPLLRRAIADAAADGKPYTKTGVNGVHARRFEMPEALHGIGKHSLVSMVDALLASEEIVQAMADNSKSVKWLDVPSGNLAQGNPTFVSGFVRREQVDERRTA